MSPAEPGLLIVNADDWGGHPGATDAIARCFEAGAITSATAMVWMSDSERAADLARERSWPLGLHLNLTQPFDAEASVPPEIRARQRRLTEAFADLPRMRSTYRPGIRRELRQAILDQLARFHELYGRAPTHVDGHQHVHICPNVLLAGALERGTRIRSTQTLPAGSGPAKRLFRRVRRRLIARRFASPRHLFAINRLAPELGGGGLSRALALADRMPIEIMVHPDRPAEMELLSSPRWLDLVRGRPLGSFADLAA